MSEYWVSRDKYWCKYCKIFIADDKPSRILHETGLKHKGNYERFIRDIYKRGEKDQKDKAEEAREMARIEAAAALAMGTSPSTSTSAAASSSRKPAAPTDKFANYSTAADLGYEEEPVDEKARLAEEERKKEGRIGQWEVVQKVKPPPAPPATAVGAGVKTEDGSDVKPTEEEAAALAAAAERQEEEERPSQKRWLKEKTAGGEDEWDPSKVAPLKLKRKILTLKEEEEIKEEEERQRKKRKEEEREKRRKEKERAKGKGPEVTKEGWQSVEVTEEPMLEFDEPEVKTEEEGAGEEGAVDGKAGEEVKPKVEEEAPKPSGFKKRKMFGAAAARKK